MVARSTSRLAGTAMAWALIVAQAQAETVQLRWMGDASCGAWRRDLQYTSLEKAVMLNWVLGYLARSSIGFDVSLMETVNQSAISGWMDNYCHANPLESLPEAARVLEGELLARATSAARPGQ